ncbi:hypothetical protein HELRODRAFT_179278 [Helobdella robusta]|uniref:Apple domain-containing protein n=1 Tax=Helobdella robusta TaxID=6412 RepID=T1FEH0_HELRO|nr:hypothetical protein HELRODRAFT_179278 [Helobdella robusta]ESN95504.1 hypothetical protein HELRODRAFT_179278 [Helobdella robusta]
MVKESSFMDSRTGYLAVDGMFDSPFCYISLLPYYQWIQIDLLWSYRLNFVQVIGKLEPNVFNVGLKNVRMVTIASCNNLTSQLNSVNVTFQCPNDSSRYVTVDQSNLSTDKMNICEVVVVGLYDEPTLERKNLLLQKNATMSSTKYDNNNLINQKFVFVAGLAVDGVRDTYLSHGHCVHSTEGGYGANWIQVDMGSEYLIDYIAFVSRNTDVDYVAQRVRNFIIGLTAYNVSEVAPVRGQYSLCNTYPGDVPVSARVTLQCNANLPAYRYIIAQQAYGITDGYFSFCELEAYEPQNTKQKNWNSRINFKLSGYEFMEFSAPRPSCCISQCMQLGESECDSFNFNQQFNICQLNKHRNSFVIGNLMFNKSWTFWNATYQHIGNR